jgi:hypothetical protein
VTFGMFEFTGWMEQTWLSSWIREEPSLYAFPLILIFHTIGLGFLAGPALALDLRLLGYARDMPLAAFRRFNRFAWLGFVMNAMSGVLLLIGYPTKNLTNPLFYFKLGLIAVGMYLWVGLSRVDEIDHRVRRLAAISIGVWASAVTAGRLLAYTYSYLMAGER